MKGSGLLKTSIVIDQRKEFTKAFIIITIIKDDIWLAKALIVIIKIVCGTWLEIALVEI